MLAGTSAVRGEKWCNALTFFWIAMVACSASGQGVKKAVPAEEGEIQVPPRVRGSPPAPGQREGRGRSPGTLGAAVDAHRSLALPPPGLPSPARHPRMQSLRPPDAGNRLVCSSMPNLKVLGALPAAQGQCLWYTCVHAENVCSAASISSTGWTTVFPWDRSRNPSPVRPLPTTSTLMRRQRVPQPQPAKTRHRSSPRLLRHDPLTRPNQVKQTQVLMVVRKQLP